MQMQFRTAEDVSCMSDCNLKFVNGLFFACVFSIN